MTEAQQRDYDKLYKQMQDFGGKYDYKLIKKAFEYCVLKHNGQKRWTNEDYYIHPFNVALIIVSLVYSRCPPTRCGGGHRRNG